MLVTDMVLWARDAEGLHFCSGGRLALRRAKDMESTQSLFGCRNTKDFRVVPGFQLSR